MRDSKESGKCFVLDTGPIYAALDPDDAHHGPCLQLLETHPGPLIVPALVVSEVAYLALRRLRTAAELNFLADIEAGTYSIQPVSLEDWPRIRELVAAYQNFPLGTVDASVIAAVERLDVTEVATLDRRHFSAVRPKHVDALNLLP